MSDDNSNKLDSTTPFYSADVKLPEITVKAVITSIVLAILLGASNAYLALKLGTTVAASIPAAIISIGIFRLFKKSNILESNLVQTAASAGEGMASVAAYTLPALIIVGYWQGFSFWNTTLLLLAGGLLGVLFSVPLRRILLNLKSLPFPEGTAVGNVLIASQAATKQLKYLVMGGAIGGLVSLFKTGLAVLADHLSLWFSSQKTLFGLSVGFDPVLIGAGYVVGPTVGLTMFLGTIVAWIIGVPVLSHVYGIPSFTHAEEAVMNLWSHHIRYIGVGTMLIAGLWTLCTLVKPLADGMKLMRQSFKKDHPNSITHASLIRTEKDLHFKYVLAGFTFLIVMLFFMLLYFLNTSHLALDPLHIWGISLIGILCFAILGFIAALIAGYLVGLIGSTNTPLSGLLMINTLLIAVLLVPLLEQGKGVPLPDAQNQIIGILIFMIAVIGSAAVITNENMQDLKAGQMVGATPWKQQIMMMVGVIAASCVMAPVLELLFKSYGIGGIFPHAGMDHNQMLLAPQASLLAAISQGAITHKLPWDLISVGIAIGVAAIILNIFLKKHGKSTPPLAVGIGIYLPPEIVITILLGGLIRYFAQGTLRKDKTLTAQAFHHKENGGILLACGLIAGSSLVGVALAIPFVIAGSTSFLYWVGPSFAPIADALSVIVTILICVFLYRVTTKK